jgi:hypothetical protein
VWHGGGRARARARVGVRRGWEIGDWEKKDKKTMMEPSMVMVVVVVEPKEERAPEEKMVVEVKICLDTDRPCLHVCLSARPTHQT